jgi:hypothetical protein
MRTEAKNEEIYLGRGKKNQGNDEEGKGENKNEVKKLDEGGNLFEKPNETTRKGRKIEVRQERIKNEVKKMNEQGNLFEKKGRKVKETTRKGGKIEVGEERIKNEVKKTKQTRKSI